MPDVISYTVCSIFYSLVVFFYFIRARHLPILRTKFFKLLLINNMVQLWLSVIVGVFSWNPTQYGIYAVTIAQIASHFFNASGATLFFLYVMNVLGFYNHKNMKRAWWCYVPLAIYVVLLLGVPFTTHSMFYIDPTTCMYKSGTLKALIYIIPGFYILTSAFVGLFIKKFDIHARVAYAIYGIASLVAITMQFVLKYTIGKNIILHPSASVLSMLVLYFSIEMPDYYTDKVAKSFNQHAFELYINDLLNDDIRISLLFIRMESYQELADQYNTEVFTTFARAFYKELENEFAKKVPIFYNQNGTFIIVSKYFSISKKSLNHYMQIFSRTLQFRNIRIDPNIKIAYLNHNPYIIDEEAILNATEAIGRYFSTIRYETKNTIFIPEEDFYINMNKEKRIEQVLIDAVHDNSIQVYFQPIVASDEHRIKSCEALSRLKDPITEEFISPDIFIRVAEKNGIINTLGEQIYRKVVKFIAEGKAFKYGLRHISVNVSMRQCLDEGLADRYLEIAKNFKVKPDAIIIEVTETEEIASTETVKKTIESFVKNGFRIAIDDFGSGYANFAYIFDLPVSTVKIDKSVFYSALTGDDNKNAAFKTIVDLVRNLQMSSIVEGVESDEQKEFLENLGLYRHQGFLYSKALPPDEFVEFVKKFNKDAIDVEVSHSMTHKRQMN